MRDQERYLELWQQKRGELQIDTDMQADWADMQQLLDIQLPVNTPPAGGTQLLHLAKYKLWYALAALLAAAAIIYFVVQHRAAKKNNQPNKTELRKDSVRSNVDISTDPNNDKAQKSALKDDSLTNNAVTDPSANNNQARDSAVNDPSANIKAGSDKNAAVHNASANIKTVPGNNLNNKPGSDVAGNNRTTTGNGNTSATNKAPGNSGPKPSTASAINGRSGAGVNGLSKPNGRNNYPAGMKKIVAGNAGKPQAPGANSRLLASSTTLRNNLTNLGGNSNGRRPWRSGRSSYASNKASSDKGRSTINHGGHVWGGRHPTNSAGPDGEEKLLSTDNTRGTGPAFLQLYRPQTNLLRDDNDIANSDSSPATNNRLFKAKPNSFIRMMAPGADKKVKTLKDKNSSVSRLDYGLLLGVNAPGSFTAKDQNKNIYGSFSPDIYVGAFGTYNINDRWAIGLQGRAFTPYTISGSYSFDHQFQADTVLVKQTLKVSDSRKIYTVDIPIHLIYKATPNINIKAGPIISLPIKEINGKSSFTMSVDSLLDTTSYYSTVTKSINAAKFEKKTRFGISAGVGITYRSLSLDATYNYYFKPQNVSSALGSYATKANSLQLTIGIRLNRNKK